MTFARRHALLAGYLIMLAALVVALARLEVVARDTNGVVKREVPRLEKQNAQATYMLNKQAVPAIVAMFAQIEALGGKPPKVLISPTEPPFAEQNP